MDAVRDNVATMLRHCGGEPARWRPHLKTTKMAPVYEALLEAGVRKFKCATLKEATVLLELVTEKGTDGVDLLVAYPHVEPTLSLLSGLANTNFSAQLSVLIEDAEGAAAVHDNLGIFVDVNVGMDRTGQHNPLEVVAAAKAAGAQLRGLHFYDGHLTESDSAARNLRANACYDYAADITRQVRAAVDGSPGSVDEIVTSGSTTFQDALAYDWSGLPPHTISPGTVVFHDARYDRDVEGLGLRPAALVLSRVISRPTTRRVTLDAGSKGLAAEAGSPVALVLDHVVGENALEALTPSEEHLPCQWAVEEPSDAQFGSLQRGDHVWLFPRHICPTVNMYDEAVLVDGSCITVPVDARGH